MKKIFLVCLLLWPVALLADSPYCEIKQYFVEEGLPQNRISDILQDKEGIIWIGSWNGLVQFDGYTFTNYNANNGERLVGNTRLNRIFLNAEGDIWCINNNNEIYLFDTSEKRYYNLTSLIGVTNDVTDNIIQLYPLKKGVTWVVLNSNLCVRVEDRLLPSGKGVTLFANQAQYHAVTHVFQDSKGQEWLLSDQEVFLYEGEKLKNSSMAFSYIVEVDGVIWLATKTGMLAYCDAERAAIQVVLIPYTVGSINNMELLPNNVIALSTTNGLVLLNEEGQFTQLRFPDNADHRNEMQSAYMDSRGDYWMLSGAAGVAHYNNQTRQIEQLRSKALPHRRQFTSSKPFIMEDPQKNVWMVSRRGNFSYYDRKKGTLEYYHANGKDSTNLIAPFCSSFCQDHQGNLWMASFNYLNKITFYNDYSELYPISDAEGEVRSFLLDSHQRFWTASKGGLVRIYNRQKQFLGYLTADGRIDSEAAPLDFNVFSMLEDEEKNIWLGSRNNGLFCLTPMEGDSARFRVTNYLNDSADNYSLSGNAVYSLCQDHRHRIWVGCFGTGINLIDRQEGQVRFLNSNNVLQNYPMGPGSRVRYLHEVADSVMLVATTRGIISFSTAVDRLENVVFYKNKRDVERPSTLCDDDAMHLLTDSRGRTYVVTWSGGIHLIESDNLLSDDIRFHSYKNLSGLNSNISNSMVEDRNGNLWVIHENSFSKFIPETGAFENFDSYSFRPNHINFSESTVAVDANGNIAVGADMGTFVFNPRDIKKSGFVPPIHFDELMVQGEFYPFDFNGREVLTLKPSQRNLSVRFAALDFTHNNNIQYAFKMEGLDTQWNYVESDRSANYMNLPTGNYSFVVKSTNSDGNWMDNETGFRIRVLPTFWESVGGHLLLVLVVALLLVGLAYVFYTILKLRQKVTVEQQLSQVKLKFFTDISHELRTPLTLIASPVEDALQNKALPGSVKEQLTVVQENTQRMLRLVNQILDFRKIQNKKMKVLVEQVEVAPYLRSIMDHFQLLANEKNIHFYLKDETQRLMLWIDKDKFEKIVFNLLSNAFKYTPNDKSIYIDLREEEGKAVLSVVDEGMGIPQKKLDSLFQRFETIIGNNVMQQSSGIGLSLVKELVELHHGSIEAISKLGEGSEFRLTFLLGNSHFEHDSQAEWILSDDSRRDEELLPAEPEESEMEPEEKFTILIVEDNPDLLKFLSAILARSYRVIEAVNGKEGLEKGQAELPDLIISDVMMPVMDGLEMVKVLKSDKNTSHIPLILLTAKASLDDRIAGVDAGIDDYITKPFSSTYLLKRIHAIIHQRQVLQELYLSSISTDGNSSLELVASQQLMTPYDKQFIQQLMDAIDENLDNSELLIEDLANHCSLGRTAFYKKIRTLFGLSPIDFVRNVKIKRAAQLIETTNNSISEIAYKCGFNDPSYFSKCFKKVLGVSPSEYKNHPGR